MPGAVLMVGGRAVADAGRELGRHPLWLGLGADPRTAGRRSRCCGSFALRLATAPEPFIPVAILREPIVAAVAIAGFFASATMIGLSIFLPLYFQLVLGFTPSGSGTALIVFLVAATAGSFIAGRLMVLTTHYKRVPLGGLVLGHRDVVVFAAKPAGLSLLEVAVLLTVGGAGLGVMYPVTTTIIQNTVEPHRLGTATGMLSFSRLLGGSIIVAAFGAIVLGGIGTGGGRAHARDAARRGDARGLDFAAVFGWLFASAAVFLAAGFVAVLAIEERPLRGPARRRGGVGRRARHSTSHARRSRCDRS